MLHDEPRKLCACGCGEAVGNPRSTFRPGHVIRLRARGAHGHVMGGSVIEESPRTCEVCDGPLRPDQKRFCSTRHMGTSYRNRLAAPKLPFNLHIYSYWVRKGRPALRQLAAELGVSDEGLLDRFEDRVPTQATVDRLRAILPDIPIPAETDTDRRRERILTHLATGGPSHEDRQAMGRKGGAAGKGREQTDEWVQKRIATRRANGALDRGRELIVAWGRSDEGRAVHSLVAYLRMHPGVDLKDLRSHATTIAGRLGKTPAAIWDYWQPYLERKGYPITGGRTPLRDRCRQVRRLRADGKPWRVVALEVAETENVHLADKDDESQWVAYVKRWYRRHRPWCRCDSVAA
jgi:hypothetical protein